MKSLLKLLVVLPTLLSSTASAGFQDSAPAKVDLDWLAGHWSSESHGRRVEEIWTKKSGGMLLGMNRSVRGDRPAMFEFLRIEFRDEGIFYVASPRGQSATEFKLVESRPNFVRFANAGHDFPQEISYRRDRDRLHAKVEGTSNKRREMQWTWTRKRPTVDKITIAVENIKQSRKFYEAILNVRFVKKEISSNAMVLEATIESRMKIQLCPKTLAGVTTSQNAIQLRFVVESVKESIDIAIKNDGTVLQNASKFEGQSVASIRDPDGYSIVLIGDAD